MTDLRCSVQSRSRGELPVGSATSADRFILVELPTPWPANIEDHPIVAELLATAGPTPDVTRILGIRGADESNAPTHRRSCKILVYRKTPGQPFTRFAGFETTVGHRELATGLAAAFADDLTSFTSIEIDLRNPASSTHDVLICTHGSRDRCCGQVGSLLFLELAGRLPANIRLWRASHTGGHRFAPTGVSFPDGLTWAFLDGHLLSGIINRTLDPAQLHSHLRGCAGFEGAEQVADAAAFGEVGWEWIDQPRAVVTKPRGELETELYIAGPRRQFTVRVVADTSAPVPVCGEPIEAAKKTSPQYLVSSIEENTASLKENT